MKSIETDTAVRFEAIRQHQAVLILTEIAGKTLRGVILSPGQRQSLIRYNEDGNLRERRIQNRRLVPLNLKPA